MLNRKLPALPTRIGLIGLTIGNFDRLCVGTGLVCRRDQALKGNAGTSELSAAANGSLAQGTVPEAVGEESMP